VISPKKNGLEVVFFKENTKAIKEIKRTKRIYIIPTFKIEPIIIPKAIKRTHGIKGYFTNFKMYIFIFLKD
jgi:hypothetical protein